MNTYCNKENVQHILPKTGKSFLTEKLQKETVSAARFLKPGCPNIFQRKESSADICGNGTRRNNTGLPDDLKTGIESLSGFSMDNVKVHYNSYKPAKLQAFAYTQGTDIHVASGQERHLPHEAWHVVQQMQGRVNPTMQINGVKINDNAALEHEADVMGRMAIQRKRSSIYPRLANNFQAGRPVQRKLIFKGITKDSSFKAIYNANTADLDEYTDKDGKIKQISQQAKFLLENEKQHMHLKPAERQNKSEQQRLKEICDSIIDYMVTNDAVYYIGNKQNIIEILAGIYYKIKNYSTIPQSEIDAHPELIIKLAIERMYYQTNNDDIRELRARDLPDAKYSSDLIEAVKAIVVDHPENEETYNLPEYQLIAIPPDQAHPQNTENQRGRRAETTRQPNRSQGRGRETAGQPDGIIVNDSNVQGRRYRLNQGGYTYRTMEQSELNKLIEISTRAADGKYRINDFENIQGDTIGKHIGNLTQAVSYSGILVRFKMKQGFNGSILNSIKGGTEGTTGAGKIGLKKENEGMFRASSTITSFSFYVPNGRDETKLFLENVDYFEVFHLGKITGRH